MRRQNWISAPILVGLPLVSWATRPTPVPVYEQSTHSVLTQHAAERSRGLADFLQDLDLEQAEFERAWVGYANQPRGVRIGNFGAADMIVAGSVLEDGADGSGFTAARSVNHFYDPIDDSSGLPFGLGMASPDWAIDSFFNSYSWEDAYDYLLGGLTSTQEGDRRREMSKALVALGTVVHLLQDCHQPSHVRGDPHMCHHLDDIWGIGNIAATTGCSALEIAGAEIVNGAVIESSIAARLNDFAPARKETVRAYFDDAAGWVNEHFFSDDTIFRDYSSPSAGTTSTTSCGADNYTDYIRSNQVSVTGTPVKLASVHSSFLCDIAAELGLGGILPQQCYSLEDTGCGEAFFVFPGAVVLENFRALLPRAIAQSEALIDHFFRARLQASFDDQGQLVIKNIARDAAQGLLASGEFLLYFEDANGVRMPVDDSNFGLSSSVPLAGPLSAGLSVTLPGDAAGFLAAQGGEDEDKRLIVVFDGEVGSGGERGIGAARIAVTSEVSLLLTFDISGSISPGELAQAKAAALSLIPILSGGESNRASVHAFSSGASIIQDFTDQLADVESAIGGLSPGGSTALFDAVVLAGGECTQEANDFPSDERKVVAIIFTDGQRNSSSASLADAAAAIHSQTHPEIDSVYLVFVGNGSSGQLANLAAASGREVFDVTNFDDLTTTFLNLLQGP